MADESFPAEIPSSNVLPEDTYELEIETAVDGHAASSGNRMFSVMARVKAPADFEGWVRFYNFVTGSKTNPNAIEQRSRGMVDFQKLAIACGVSMAGRPIGATLTDLIGKRFGEWMKEKMNTERGEPENKTARFFKLGEFPIGQGPPQAMAPGAGAAAVRGTANANDTRTCASCGQTGIPAADFRAHAETCATGAAT